MKKLCLFVFAFSTVLSVFAQSEKGYVYLKNGTILKGKYQYSNDFNKLKVESAGNLWIFEAAEVDSITGIHARRLKTFNNESLNSPFYLRTEIGVLAGSDQNSQAAPFSFTSTINYQIRPKISIGTGLGLEFLKESYLPVFLNFEYKIRQSYSVPYFFLKAGYQVPLEESQGIYYSSSSSSSIWPGPLYTNENRDAKGGFLLNSGIGYQRMFSSGFGMSFAFGYQFHRLHYKGENKYALDIDYNRLTIKLGILFN